MSPPISTYRASPSVCEIISPVPQVSVPSLCVVMMEQLARLVTAREVPVIPPATLSLVPGVESPIPTLPLLRCMVSTSTFPTVMDWKLSLALTYEPPSHALYMRPDLLEFALSVADE